MSTESDVVTLCQALVQRKSLSGRESSVAQIVEDAMNELGFTAVGRDAMGSVIGVLEGELPGRRVLMDAHMDVVPISEPEKWRHDPFGGEIDDGKLWGRGATDVKGSLAALIVAVGRLDQSALHGTIIVSAGVAEEGVEGYALAHAMKEHTAHAVVICEPTWLQIGLGHKGRARVTIVAPGVAAHSSKPDEGVNAIMKMVPVLERLRGLEPVHDMLLGAGVTEVIGIRSRPDKPTAMVPYECAVEIDRRTVRGETPETVLEDIRHALTGLGAIEVSLKESALELYTGHSLRVDEFHSAWAIDASSDLASRSQRALQGIGQAGDFFFAPYCTNGAHSGGDLGVPTIIYGAGGIEDAHIIDEKVAIDELLGAFAGYQALAYELGR